jgi:hypothetical protein
MNRTLQFLVFISIFLTLYGAMNFYVFWRMSALLSLKRNLIFYIAFLGGTFSYLIAAIMESRFPGLFSRLIYIAAALWMGILFILFSLVLVYEILHLFIKFPPVKTGIVLLCISGVLTLYSLINASIVHVKTIRIKSNKVQAALNFVQISDLHFGSIRTSSFLSRIIQKINALNPDAVFITGDLVDGPYHYKEEDFAPLRELNMPVFLVTGNHERYAGLDTVMRFLKKTPVHLLQNAVTNVKGVEIVGIDDADKKRQVEEILPTLKRDAAQFSILLYHRPVPGILKTAQREGIDLVLCGHVHAGQIVPFNFIVSPFYRPVRGFHKYQGSFLNVLMGTGTWGPPMRLGSSSEIARIIIERNTENPARLTPLPNVK